MKQTKLISAFLVSATVAAVAVAVFFSTASVLLLSGDGIPIELTRQSQIGVDMSGTIDVSGIIDAGFDPNLDVNVSGSIDADVNGYIGVNGMIDTQ